MYSHFLQPSRVNRTQQYLRRYERFFTRAKKEYGIPKEVIASILLVETDLGRYTGNYLILPRLARLANAASPTNIEENYQRLLHDGETVTREEVERRGAYLLELFTPEVEATLRISEARGFSPFAIRGSPAGAFGYPQFLPHSFEKFAIDGNGDGRISLFQHPDAIVSVGNFLSHHLKASDLLDKSPTSRQGLQKAVFQYNRSQPYVDAVLGLSEALGLKLQ